MCPYDGVHLSRAHVAVDAIPGLGVVTRERPKPRPRQAQGQARVLRGLVPTVIPPEGGHFPVLALANVPEAMPFYYLAHALLGMLPSTAAVPGHNAFANVRYGDLLDASRTLVGVV